MSKPSKSKLRAIAPQRKDDDGTSRSLQSCSSSSEDEIIIVPTREAAPTISLTGFLIIVASFFLFKGATIAWIGGEDYSASIRYLKSGTVFEQAAAFVMAPDVLSNALAGQFQRVLP